MNNIVVQTSRGVNHIPVSDIDLLLVDTLEAVITSGAINALSRNQVDVIFIDKYGQPATHVLPIMTERQNASRVIKQVNWDADRQEILWTKIVNSKIANQIQVCQMFSANTDDLENERMSLEIGDSTNREAVVARKYFEKMFGPRFSRRELNPINAALNYGYSVLLSFIDKEIVSRGNLPAIGIHHNRSDSLFNLGSDFMEPFRPVVDAYVRKIQFEEINPLVKYGLVDLLNLEVKINGKSELLRNAMSQYVRECLSYLNADKDAIELEVKLPNEVSNNEINGHV